ncbi:gamma-glutamyltransferase [soil metagenome]
MNRATEGPWELPVPASTSFTGALATPHAAATDAGVQAYRDGGTAIDAALAAAAMLTVVYPHNVALGGDLIALVRNPSGDVVCVNASGWAGRDGDVEVLRAKYGSALPLRGPDTVTVPGGIRGWETLRTFGTRLSWQRTLAAAADAAAAGVPVSTSLANHIADQENHDLYGPTDFDRVFRPKGVGLAAGEDLRQPALADTVRLLQEDGPDAFYTGSLADRTVAYLRSRGSRLSIDDFAEFATESVEPLRADFCGLTVLTSPPNTHGFLLLRALRSLGDAGVGDSLGSGFGSLMETFLRGNQMRAVALADPRHATVDVDALINDDPAVAGSATELSAPGGDTVGISAVDSDGYAISLIQSVYDAFGSGLIDPETGILFHSRGRSFSLNNLSPNVFAPRKRPLHTLMPTMTLQRGAVKHVLSTMGGQGQPQIIAQLLLRGLQGSSAEDVVAAPRGVVGQQVNGVSAETICAETDLDEVARTSLMQSDLAVEWVSPHTESLGQANVVFVASDRGMTAASDPRSDGSAVVVQFARHRS